MSIRLSAGDSYSALLDLRRSEGSGPEPSELILVIVIDLLVIETNFSMLTFRRTFAALPAFQQSPFGRIVQLKTELTH